MLKKLFFLFFSALLVSSVNAQVVIDNATINDVTVTSGIRRDSAILQTMLGYSGLIAYKDYGDDQSTPDLDFAAGVGTGTFTSSRSATNPATYMTWDGTNCVTNVSTTANVPLYDTCYYDETGAHAANIGYHAWRSSTNLLTRTDGTAYTNGLWTGWTANSLGSAITGTATVSNEDNSSILNISGTTTQRVRYVGIVTDSNKDIFLRGSNTAVGTVVNGDTITLSFLAKSQTGFSGVTVRGAFIIRDSSSVSLGGHTGSDISTNLSSDFRKFSYTYTVTDATASLVSAGVSIASIDNGDTVDFEIAELQLEKLPYATPFIPTTTAALTRNADVLKYLNLGNSHADEETIMMEVTPGATFENTKVRAIHSSDTKNREISDPSAAATDLRAYPNSTDSINSSVASGTAVLKDTTYIICAVFKHSSPYVQLYIDGVSAGVDTADNFINNTWGHYFYVGSSAAGINQFDGNIRRWAKWKRALTVTEIAEITALWQANP